MVTRPLYPDGKDPNSFESGLQFQDFVVEIMRDELGIGITNYQSQRFQFGVGENKQGIEIKLDRAILRTSRLSIEISEKSRAHNAEFVPSGIYRSDNSWLYIQGNWDIVFIFAKNILRLLHTSGRYEEHEAGKDPDRPTVKGFYLPLDDAKKYAAKFIEINTDVKKLERWKKSIQR